jgi:hypothetical protein
MRSSTPTHPITHSTDVPNDEPPTLRGPTVLADCGAAAPAPAVANTSPPPSPSYTAQLRSGLAHIWGIASLRACAGALPNVHVPPRHSEPRQPPTNQRKRERSTATSDHHGALRDVVADIAGRYPIPITCGLLGAPRQDWHLFSDWAEDIFKIFTWNVANDAGSSGTPSTNSTPTSTAWSPSGAATSPTT